MKKLTQPEIVEAYNNGKILHNTSRGKKDVYVFKFLGKMRANKNIRRDHKYQFDDCCWEIVDKPFMYKVIQTIYHTKTLKDCENSIKAGVK